MQKLFLLFAFIACVAATNSTSTRSSCTKCGSSTDYVDVATWCAKYTGWSQTSCQCIVNAESSGNANACNLNTNGSYDVGLWQINDMNWDSCNDGDAPCDPSENLVCAEMIFGWGGNTWTYWSTCETCGVCDTK